MNPSSASGGSSTRPSAPLKWISPNSTPSISAAATTEKRDRSAR